MNAGPLGATAVVPLGEVASGANREASIAAQRALKNIAAYTVRLAAVHILEQSPADAALTGKLLDAYRSAKPDTRDPIIRVLSNWNSKKLALRAGHLEH